MVAGGGAAGASATWVEDGRPLQVGKLLGTQVQTPEVPQAGLEPADCGPGGLLLLLLAGARPVQQDPLQQAVGGRVGHLEVQTLLGQTQDEERSPTAAQQRHLVLAGHLAKGRQVLNEADRLEQDACRLPAHLQGLQEAHSPQLLLTAAPAEGSGGGGQEVRVEAAPGTAVQPAQDVEEDGGLGPGLAGALAPLVHGTGAGAGVAGAGGGGGASLEIQGPTAVSSISPVYITRLPRPLLDEP